MPNATILCPREGDTVNKDNVLIAVAYANFSVATDLRCRIKTFNDDHDPENVSGEGLHMGTATTDALPRLQTVITYTASPTYPLARQDNVIVVSNDPPVIIDDPTVGLRSKKSTRKKLKKVTGKVPRTSTATKVVCQLYMVNTNSGTVTPVGGPKESPINDHKWRVDYDIVLDPDDTIQYFARVCVFRNNTLLGCGSRAVIK